MQEDWIISVSVFELRSIQAVILNIHIIWKDPVLTWRTFPFQDGVDYQHRRWHTIIYQNEQHITHTLIKCYNPAHHLTHLNYFRCIFICYRICLWDLRLIKWSVQNNNRKELGNKLKTQYSNTSMWKWWRERKREEKSPLKDGCVWQAGLSWVVGQEVERDEGQPDETMSSTWVPLTLYICPRPSAAPHHMVTSSFAAWALFNENRLLLPSSPFYFFSGAGEPRQKPPFRKLLLFVWLDSPPYAGWAVSLFQILLFWFCFRIALSSISPSIWTSLTMVLWFCEIKQEKRSKAPANMLPGKTTLWYFGLVARRLFSHGHHCSFIGLSQGCWDGRRGRKGIARH